jgi:hypothetical protein
LQHSPQVARIRAQRPADFDSIAGLQRAIHGNSLTEDPEYEVAEIDLRVVSRETRQLDSAGGRQAGLERHVDDGLLVRERVHDLDRGHRPVHP